MCVPMCCGSPPSLSWPVASRHARCSQTSDWAATVPVGMQGNDHHQLAVSPHLYALMSSVYCSSTNWAK